MVRTRFPAAYRFASGILLVGCLTLALWLIVAIVNATTALALPFSLLLLDVGALLAVTGILTGALLDYLAMRETQNA
jgi:PAT family beta-lactamase induction signal transducer AmpG